MADIQCPHCSQLLQAARTARRQQMVCPMCASAFWIENGRVSANPGDGGMSGGAGHAATGWSSQGPLGHGPTAAPPRPTVQAPPPPPRTSWADKPKKPKKTVEPPPEPEDEDPWDELATPADEEGSRFSDMAVYGLAAAVIFLVALIGSVLLARYVRAKFAGSLVGRPDAETQRWIQQLQHSARRGARKQAAEALVSRGGLAVEAALKATTDLAPDGRSVLVSEPVIESFTSLGPEVVKPAAVCLRSKRVAVRAAAAQILASQGPAAQEVVDELARVVNDPNRVVRWNAIRALARIGPEAVVAVDELLAAASHSDRSTRRWAIRALGSIGPPAAEASGVLVGLAADDGDPAIRAEASLAVERINLRQSARMALEQAGEEVRRLIEQLGSSDEHKRVAAARKLGELGFDAVEAVPELTLRLDDSDKWMREAAASALGQLGQRAVVAVPTLRRAARDSEPEVRRAAEEALRAIDVDDEGF